MLHAQAAAPAEISVRQCHIFFQFVRESDRTVCAVQEIVVVEWTGTESFSGRDGSVLWGIPKDALDVMPLPVPPMMPGTESTPALAASEIVVSSGEIKIKRHLHPGKNVFSFGYMIPAANDAMKFDRKILLPVKLLVSFAPPVGKLTSSTLKVEPAEEGFKVMGFNLEAGSAIDLLFESVSKAAHEHSEGVMGSSPEPVPPAGDSKMILGISTVAGLAVAVIIFVAFSSRKKSGGDSSQLRRMLMDDIESIDAALEKKEISAEYHKAKKKELMERLREIV